MQWFIIPASQPLWWIAGLAAAVLVVLWRWYRRLLLPLVGIVVGVSSAIFVVAGGLWWQAKQDQGKAPASPPSANLTQDAKDRLESYEKRADDLEKLLSLLVAMTAVYGIALGLNAYAQAKDSAEKLAKIQDDAEKEAKRIESRFPLLADMDEGLRAMMSRLTHLFPVIDWSEESYHALQPEEKQEVLYYEKAVAALEPFNLRGVRREVSEIYRGLGNFYGSRYGSEREEWNKGYWTPAPLEDDKERARFYLDRSLRQDRTNVRTLNDRVFYSLNISPGDEEYTKAFGLCQDSLKVDPGQQRARYNLAYLEHVVRKNYRRSVELLTDALARRRWQRDSPAQHHFSMLYNRACAHARLGEKDEAATDLEEAIPASIPSDVRLRGQFQADIRLLEVYFRADIKPAGDLYSLSTDTAYRHRMQVLAERLQAYRPE